MTIRGVATRHLQRWLQSEQDDPQDPWKTTGVHPTSLRLRGEGVAEIEGWRCDASQEIAFASERDGRPAAFEGCSLATGNRADEIDFPPVRDCSPATAWPTPTATATPSAGG